MGLYSDSDVKYRVWGQGLDTCITKHESSSIMRNQKGLLNIGQM